MSIVDILLDKIFTEVPGSKNVPPGSKLRVEEPLIVMVLFLKKDFGPEYSGIGVEPLSKDVM